jgi:hypothetical protein
MVEARICKKKFPLFICCCCCCRGHNLTRALYRHFTMADTEIPSVCTKHIRKY